MTMTKKLFILGFIVLFAFPYGAEAKYGGEVAGWVPWFGGEEAAQAAEKRLRDLDTLYLFVYEIDDQGKIVSKVDLKDGAWEDLIEEARDQRVDIIPTIAWFDGEAIHETLSNRRDRRALVRDIDDLVDDNNYDGVDIDFEQKKGETIDYFSTFLEELEDKLGRDDLVCTIEARMEPEHRWRDVPSKIEYANDYKKINKHCDRIQIMAYDQQRADIVINELRRGVPYAPVADKIWVEHVLEVALEDFDEDKVMLGVPTYGRAWDVTVAPDWYRDYKRVASLNHKRILELSDKYDAPIGRSEGGEGVISYFPEDSIYKVLNALPVPEGTPKGFEAAAKALFFATRTGMEVPVRFVTWSDAPAIEDKVKLAEKYSLKGISIFKIDGEEDPDIWKLF